MYTANIDSKTFSGGKLTVKITYSNGNENITDTHESTQKQDVNWLNELIIRKLDDLNSLYDINKSIIVGEFKIDNNSKSEKDIYYEKAAMYMKYMEIARMGLIAHDRPIIVELNTWLKANFKDEYINLF